MKIEFHELEYYEKNSIVLKFYQNISNFFHGTQVHSLELEYQEKLDFLEIKFQKGEKLLNIFTNSCRLH